jgi:hypothetical protein
MSAACKNPSPALRGGRGRGPTRSVGRVRESSRGACKPSPGDLRLRSGRHPLPLRSAGEGLGAGLAA